MKTSIELKEKRGLLDNEFNTLKAKVAAKTPFTDAEELRFDEIVAEITTLNSEITKAEGRELAIADSEKRQAKPSVATYLPNATKDNEAEVSKRFSMRKLIWDIGTKGVAEGVELEVSQEGSREAKQAEITTYGYTVPSFIIGNDVKSSEERAEKRYEMEKRATLTTSIADTPKAGYFIQTDVYGEQWIDVLRNAMVLVGAGADFWDGLVGNVTIPKKTTAATVAWLAETDAITSNHQVHGSVSLSPKRVGGAVPFTKTLLRQQGKVGDKYVQKDLADGIAVALQLAALSGSGSSNQPTGISTALTTTGGSNLIAMGTNGLAPTWASIVELQKQVSIANADMGKIAYILNSATRGKMKTVAKDAGSGLFLMPDNGVLNGERTFISNSVRSNLTKGSSSGVCSEAFFGNWDDLIIASWGGLDIVVDPYSLNKSNQIEVVVNGFYDIGIKREASFATIKDYLTA